jgi:hypothetical protein
VHAAFQQVAKTIEHKLLSTSHKLQWDPASGRGAVSMDQSELERMMMSLLIFACDATPLGGVIAVSTADLSDMVQIRVRTARGAFGETDVAQLLEPLARVGPHVKLHRLGPAICKHMVEEVGGSIGIDVDPETGCLITIKIPAGRSVAAARPEAAELKDVVLLSDDDRVIESCRRALEGSGHHLRVFADAQVALENMEASPAHLLILDPRRVLRRDVGAFRHAFAQRIVPAAAVLKTMPDLEFITAMPELPPYRLLDPSVPRDELRRALDWQRAQRG